MNYGSRKEAALVDSVVVQKGAASAHAPKDAVCVKNCNSNVGGGAHVLRLLFLKRRRLKNVGRGRDVSRAPVPRAALRGEGCGERREKREKNEATGNAAVQETTGKRPMRRASCCLRG